MFHWIRSRLKHVTLRDLIEMEKRIMSAISDFAAKQNAHNTAVSTALTDLGTEITNLNATIAALQASAGAITPADQALLDQVEASGAALEAKAKALDTLTPPTPPTA